jgi:hypothetical protein
MAEKSERLWSKSMTEHHHPFPFPPGVLSDACGRSTMSMLDFYRNRASRTLSALECAALEKAKTALRVRSLEGA